MVQRSRKATFKKCINCQGLMLNDPGQNIIAEAFCSLECRNKFYERTGIPSFVTINRAKSGKSCFCVIDRHLLARISLDFEVIDKK